VKVEQRVLHGDEWQLPVAEERGGVALELHELLDVMGVTLAGVMHSDPSGRMW
jgi:hypothetical protein